MTGPGADGQGITTPEQLEAMAQGFRQSRILFTAYELDLFTAVGQGTATSAEVAARIGAEARATDRLMNALVAIGLLGKAGGVFANTPLGARFLVRGTDDYMSSLGHAAGLYGRWASLTEAVRAGGTVLERVTGDAAECDAFIEAMHHRAIKTADRLIAHIDLEGVARVLDVGGGSGVYSMAFCRAGDGLSAVVLDLPEVTPLTRRYVAEGGFAGRIDTADGDYLECDFGAGFDLVFFSAIVHSNAPDENRLLMKKAFAALKPGGRIAVQDFVMDESRVEPAFGAVFALNMLVNTPAGDTFTESEIGGWLTDAGCTNIVRRDTGPFTAMLLGTKLRE
jgi:2-polyprenyl-3-methyl-5-hydroxy-6-metoxy-1,4-benzoquinol methylase